MTCSKTRSTFLSPARAALLACAFTAALFSAGCQRREAGTPTAPVTTPSPQSDTAAPPSPPASAASR